MEDDWGILYEIRLEFLERQNRINDLLADLCRRLDAHPGAHLLAPPHEKS